MDQDNLLQFLHSIHNKIRNANGIKLTGLSALNEINNFFALYFIKDKVIKKGLPESCSFDYIYKNYATDEIISADRKLQANKSSERISYKLWCDVYYANNEDQDCVLKQISMNDYFSKYFANDVTRISAYATNPKACDTIQEIINMMYKKFDSYEFNYKLFDALGSAYERFKTDEISNQGKNTGQHFTPVSIKQLIVDEIKPSSTDIFYEPCAGSGGFIHTACSYVYTHDKKNLGEFKKKIYANEINPEIQKPLVINMLLHDIPVTKFNTDGECDSLSFENCKRYTNKFTKCATNVPFGVKTNLNANDDYWDPVTSGKKIIKESTAQFIVHIYHSLKVGGVAGIVVDRGILNNGTEGNAWQKKFRKWLLENTNLYRILLLPTGIFDYTNFATAVIFFKKGEKTKKVDFYEVNFVDPKKKGDVKVGEKPLKSLTIKEIEQQNWSLKLELEEKQELQAGWVKLGDIFTLYPTTKHCTSIGKDKGKYRFYSSSQIDKLYCDDAEINKESIIIGNGGCANVHYDTNFTPSKHVTACFSNSNNINIKLIYYYFRINMNILENEFSGGGLKWLNRTKIENIKIPLLSLTHQQEIVTFLDAQFEKYNINLLSEYTKDIKLFDLLIAKEYEMCADALHLIYRKIETDALIKSLDRDKKAVFNITLGLYDYEKIELKTLINNTKTGETIKEDLRNHEKSSKYNVPYYGTGSITGYTDNYLFNGEYLLFSQDGSVGNVFIVNGKFWCNHHIRCIQFDKTKTSTKFMLMSMKYEKYDKITTTHSIPNIPWTKLSIHKFKLPSLEDQQKIITEIELIEKEQETYKKYGEKLQKLLDNMQQIIEKTTQKNKVDEPENNDDQSEELEKKPKKKKVQKKLEVDEVIEVVEEVEKKPNKKKVQKEPEVEEIEEENVEKDLEWDTKVLKLMNKHKEKTDKNKTILIKLRNDNNIDKDLFWNKVKELRKEKQSVQKTK